MERSEWFEPKWLWLKRFALLAALGIGISVFAAYLNLLPLAGISVLLVAPLIFWLAFIPVLHWKDRYRGDKSAVWGAFLVFETSSWSKLVYWFVHVLPDWRKSKQYEHAP